MKNILLCGGGAVKTRNKEKMGVEVIENAGVRAHRGTFLHFSMKNFMVDNTNATNVTTNSYNYTVGSYVNTAGNIIDKWFIGKKAHMLLKDELFSTLAKNLDVEYKVKIEKKQIVIDGVETEGFHLLVSKDSIMWTYQESPTWPTLNKKYMEITCSDEKA